MIKYENGKGEARLAKDVNLKIINPRKCFWLLSYWEMKQVLWHRTEFTLSDEPEPEKYLQNKIIALILSIAPLVLSAWNNLTLSLKLNFPFNSPLRIFTIIKMMLSGQRDRLRPPRGLGAGSWRMPGVQVLLPLSPCPAHPSVLLCWVVCAAFDALVHAIQCRPAHEVWDVLFVIKYPQFGCYKIEIFMTAEPWAKHKYFLPGRGESKINYQRNRANGILWSQRGQGGLSLGGQWYSVQIMGCLVTDVFSSFPVIPLSFLLPQGFSPNESMPFIVSKRRMGKNKND